MSETKSRERVREVLMVKETEHPEYRTMIMMKQVAEGQTQQTGSVISLSGFKLTF
jgi:hypothetical protein